TRRTPTPRRGLSSYLETSQPLRPDDPLITSETGAAISVRSIQSVIRELARRAKITRLAVTAHSMRHTFALNYLERNPGKLVELAALLGNESLDTTAVYLRPSQEEMAQGVERSRLNATEGSHPEISGRVPAGGPRRGGTGPRLDVVGSRSCAGAALPRR